jgi:murein DD-endopeptidase MepM/ murein hydrolase activator NlpD
MSAFLRGIDWPLQENTIRRGMTNHTFGWVRNNGKKEHQGWDFYAPIGTPCYAVQNGKVQNIRDHDYYGICLDIKLYLPDGFLSPDGRTEIYARYAHLSSVAVRIGQEVSLGQIVAYSGRTGKDAKNQDGEDLHLHFELLSEPQPGGSLGGRYDPKLLYGEPPLRVVIPRLLWNTESYKSTA